MGSLDDLPTRHPTHVLDDRAVKAFTDAVQEVGKFFVQQTDRKDYGTDLQLEVGIGESATNVRVHVQLKGTEEDANADGSVSVQVERTNLNYLLAQPSSFYACFHSPTGRLLAKLADDVVADYDRRGKGWLDQQTITVRFHSPFDRSFQERVATHALSAGRVARDRRLMWAAAPPDVLVDLIRTAPPAIEVPASPEQASSLLDRLYAEGRDSVISSSFEQLCSVLSDQPNEMMKLRLADINVALNGGTVPAVRLRDAITFLETGRTDDALDPGPTLYNEANGWLALKDHERALSSFRAALPLLERDAPALAAQCHKNMGSALEALHRGEQAREAYENSLRCNPDLGEARYALGLWHARNGDHIAALEHLDLFVRDRVSALRPAGVQGWRAFNLLHVGRVHEGLRVVLELINHADQHKWIWNWSASMVSKFGTGDATALTLSLTFWRHFLRAHPDSSAARFEQLICISTLHWLAPEQIARDGYTYERFKASALDLMKVDSSVAPRLWDWIGHWAQDDEDWPAAADAYAQAAAADPAKYGYCLGVALLHLNRYAEALEVLLPQALEHEPDALSWFQVAGAHAGMGDRAKAIDAYKRAIALEPDYALAWFNLGGAYWNLRDYAQAESTWTEALRRFPEHELAAEATKMLRPLMARRVAMDAPESKR